MHEEEQYQEERPDQFPRMMGHTSEGALQFQLEGQKIVDRLLKIIAGYGEQIDPSTGAVTWEKTQKPMVNKKGINMIRGYLTSFVSGTKTYALSDLDDEYISQEVISIGKNIIRDLQDNWVQYELISPSAGTFILHNVCASVNAVLRKGMDANYLKFLRTTHNISEIQNHSANTQAQMPQENRPIWKKFFGRQ